MKKIIFALLFVLLPVGAYAQSSINKYPVGTCMQAPEATGFYQQLSDGSWAAPDDKLNTCEKNGFNAGGVGGWSTWPNQYQYNPTLGQMTSQEWFNRCVLMNTLLPLPECQGYNPLMGAIDDQFGFLNNLMDYPQFGRDYLAINGSDTSLYLDLSNSENKWKDILIGVGMGWLLNRLSS